MSRVERHRTYNAGMRNRLGAAALLALSCLTWNDAFAGRAPAPAAPLVVVAEYDGIIHPIAAEFFDEVISSADARGAVATVIVLRTPGGLLESTRAIVTRMIAARAPVVVFVGPAGGRAASAGFLIALAADVVAMAPGTHIGAAHPVSAGPTGGGTDETMAKKVASDVAAYARTLAETRARNPGLAAAAVTESRAFTAREALDASPRLVELMAQDVGDLLRQLDGRDVRRFDGRTVTLHTAGAAVARAEMTWRQQFLGAIADPTIAYLLLTLGLLGLTVELWNPGTVLPGVAGGVCLLLAFFAFQVLPINVTGVMLLVFGFGLLVLELKMPSFGALGIGGAVSLLVGSLMLTREVPGVPVGHGIIVAMVVALAGIFLFLGRLALAAQRTTPVTGVEGLVGERGFTLESMAVEHGGQVRVHGEIWRARSAASLECGHPVRVVAVDGLTLVVEPDVRLRVSGDTPA
jgi:membrane-bound serine protease (ClpP class)